MPQSRAHKDQTRRNYKSEYQNYQGQPEQVHNRSLRNQARSYEMSTGNVKKGDGLDIDHIDPLIRGGGNSPSNLRVRSEHKNRSFPRNKYAGMK